MQVQDQTTGEIAFFKFPCENDLKAEKRHGGKASAPAPAALASAQPAAKSPAVKLPALKLPAATQASAGVVKPLAVAR